MLMLQAAASVPLGSQFAPVQQPYHTHTHTEIQSRVFHASTWSLLTSFPRQNHIFYYLHNDTPKNQDRNEMINPPWSQCEEPVTEKQTNQYFNVRIFIF